VTREHKGAHHTLAALKSIRAARPGGYRLFVIMDNLAANKTPAIRRWASRANVELCLTPTNASWANPIEANFGPLRTFVIGTSDYPNHTVLARKVQDYLRWRNAHARHPDVLAAQRRERARIRSERQQRWGRPKPKAA
jgi:transposase